MRELPGQHIHPEGTHIDPDDDGSWEEGSTYHWEDQKRRQNRRSRHAFPALQKGCACEKRQKMWWHWNRATLEVKP